MNKIQYNKRSVLGVSFYGGSYRFFSCLLGLSYDSAISQAEEKMFQLLGLRGFNPLFHATQFTELDYNGLL